MYPSIGHYKLVDIYVKISKIEIESVQETKIMLIIITVMEIPNSKRKSGNITVTFERLC